MKVKEYAEKYQIYISKVYQMIKNEELYVVKMNVDTMKLIPRGLNFPI
ncbi:hypothetical protein [Enterococcus cecorum]